MNFSREVVFFLSHLRKFQRRGAGVGDHQLLIKIIENPGR